MTSKESINEYEYIENLTEDLLDWFNSEAQQLFISMNTELKKPAELKHGVKDKIYTIGRLFFHKSGDAVTYYKEEDKRVKAVKIGKSDIEQFKNAETESQ